LKGEQADGFDPTTMSSNKDQGSQYQVEAGKTSIGVFVPAIDLESIELLTLFHISKAVLDERISAGNP
jgi:hypothetical protein